MSSPKSKSRQSFVDPFELGKQTVQTVRKETVKEAQRDAKVFLSQLLGINLDDDDQSGKAPVEKPANTQEAVQTNTHSGEIFDLAKHQPSSEKPKAHTEKASRRPVEAALDYHREIVKNREKASKTEMREMQRNIEQIKVELTKLIAASQSLNMEFGSISVEQSTDTVGQYHLSFFEWMLTVVRSARQKVEDSQSWMGAIKGKGAKKSYWGMFKKHGTTFGLSDERSVATQVG